jgi:hypothetical protein
MKAPVELHSVTETYDVLGSHNNVIMPFFIEFNNILLNCKRFMFWRYRRKKI